MTCVPGGLLLPFPFLAPSHFFLTAFWVFETRITFPYIGASGQLLIGFFLVPAVLFLSPVNPRLFYLTLGGRLGSF